MRKELLIVKLKEGNPRAFRILFDKYYHPLCIYLRSFTSDMDTAQDLAQSVFVEFWNKRQEIKIKTSVKSYLFRMGYNLFLMSLREKNKKESLLEELKFQALEEEESRPEQELKEATERLRNIITTLPPRCREILQLRMQGYKYQEIGEQLEVSVKTVESQMRIAFTKIREGFKDGLFLWTLVLGKHS